MMPGKIDSLPRSRAIRFSRSSSFTLRVRSLCSEKELFLSSPRVRGRFMKGLCTALYARMASLLHVAVAAGALARAQSLLDFGNGSAVVLSKRLHPFRFRLHLQQGLFEVQIDRQFVGQVKRERGSVILDFNVLPQDRKQLLVQLDQGLLRAFDDL